MPDKIKVKRDSWILYAKFASQLLSAKYATGHAIMFARITHFVKISESNNTIFCELAPITLRMPISCVRCSVVYDASPNNPRQANKNTHNREINEYSSDLLLGYILFIQAVIQESVFKWESGTEFIPLFLDIGYCIFVCFPCLILRLIFLKGLSERRSRIGSILLCREL